MTGAGIALYLLLYMHDYTLAAVTVAAFGPLIGFHFAIDRIKPGKDKEEMKNRIIKIRSLSGHQSYPYFRSNIGQAARGT